MGVVKETKYISREDRKKMAEEPIAPCRTKSVVKYESGINVNIITKSCTQVAAYSFLLSQFSF